MALADADDLDADAMTQLHSCSLNSLLIPQMQAGYKTQQAAGGCSHALQ